MPYSLGVDLGTTFTAAAIDRDGSSSVAQLGTNRAAVPSVVLYRGDDTVLTGDAAERRSRTEPDRVAREFKRRFGDSTPVFVGGTPRSPEQLTAQLLSDTVKSVVDREGGPPAGIAITHPASWGDYKLSVLEQAVRLAGLTGVTFVAEPIAAAVHYASLERVPDDAVLAVYDLGGGTFDAAVVAKRAGRFEILGQPEGIERLGGIDFDAAVLRHVQESLGDALDELDPVGAQAVRLRDECIAAKEALSTDTDVTIAVIAGGSEHEVRLTRAEFEEMIRPVLATTLEATSRALSSAMVTPDGLHAILLVGGGSRIPLVAEMVINEYGRPVAVDAHPKHAIAMGAARYLSESTQVAAAVPARAPVPDPPLPPGPTRVVSPPTRRTPLPDSGANSSARWWAGVAVVVALVAVGAFFWSQNGGGQDDDVVVLPTTEAPVATASTPPSMTATTASDPDATDAPATTVPPSAPAGLVGDLGLAVPITQPECDEQNITVLFSAIDPSVYGAEVSARLAEYPGSSYLRTASTCPSLRGQFVDGSDIYVVYFGPFATEEEACAARTQGPVDAYVKKLSLTVPSDFEVACG